MPQSRTRYQRAEMRSRYRKPKRRRGGSLGWNMAIAMVVVVGVVLIVLVRSGGDDASGRPRVADPATGTPVDHWHSFLGVDICGEWLANAPTFDQAASTGAQAGIHSHGDGLIHTHPFVSSEAGGNATVGKFFQYGGWGLSESSIDAWSGPPSKLGTTRWANGDKCTFGDEKGRPGRLVWAVDGKVQTGNPADYRQQNGETIAIGFLPEGVKLPFPPGACAAYANISDQDIPAVVSKKSPCRNQAATSTTTATTPGTSTPPTS
jgi:hypothetical protein